MFPRICFRNARPKAAFNRVVAVFCLSLTILGIVYTWTKESPRRSPIIDSARLRLQYLNSTNSSEKLIYLHNFPWFYEFKDGSGVFEKCAVKECSFTTNPSDMSISDAIMFFTTNSMMSPPTKTHNQIWIYFSVESPLNSHNNNFGSLEWENLINWTMTYRKDSDIVFGYGAILNKTEQGPKKDYLSIVRSKTKLIAWFVSNCNTNSQRMRYVKLLQRYVPVDVYGNCGPLKCPRDKDEECINMLNKDYKFYLSFENSICLDYATEKLYRMLKYDIVPIARGGANYSRLLPIKSVISTSDFFTIHDLAEFIKYLDTNENEYLKYFSWKTSYSIQEPQHMPFCEICEKLHNPHKWHNVYKNVDDWWRKGACHDATDLKAEL